MKFSVTIPAYKRQYLDEAIHSVLSQTYTDWELIIVDDCSPEDLASVVKPYLTDERVRYYRNAKNCGAVNVVDNWNICLEYCTGDYVICIGDDDRLLPACLEEYSKLINTFPELNVYHGWAEIIDCNGNVIDIQQPRPCKETVLSLIWNRWDNRRCQFIGDFCYSTTFLKKQGGYYKLPLAWGSDDITAVIAAQEGGIANTQELCFQYRSNSQSITSSDTASIKLETTLLQDKWYEEFLNKIDVAGLSPSDKCYYQTIGAARSHHFSNLGKDFIEAVKGNPVRFFSWYRRLRGFNFSKMMYFKWYLHSCLCIFK